jgi:hypothetical protein
MRTDPVGEALCPGRLRIGVVRGAKRGDKQLSSHHLAGRPVDHLQRRAGVVHEQALTGDVGLPHRRRQSAFPGPIQLTEAAIAISLRVRGAVLLPH